MAYAAPHGQPASLSAAQAQHMQARAMNSPQARARPGSTAQQVQQQQQQQQPQPRQISATQLGSDALSGPAAKRRKPAIDRHLPIFYPESPSTQESDELLQSLRQSYVSLEGLEKKLDWTLSRKRAEWTEVVGRSGTMLGVQGGKLAGVKRTLGVKVGHDVSEGQWTLKLGGVLQQEEGEDKMHFSQLVSKVSVAVSPEDPANPASAQTIDWTPTEAPLDGLTLSRPVPSNGTSSLNLRISLALRHHPERYAVPDFISRVLSLQECTKAQALRALWAYITKHELQDSDNRQCVRLDLFLSRVINVQPQTPVLFSYLAEKVLGCFHQPEPVSMPYTLDLSQQKQQQGGAVDRWDVHMYVPDPAGPAISRFLSSLANGHSVKQIVQSDLTLAALCSSIKSTKARRDVCAAFASDPVQFIWDYLESQSVDLDGILERRGERAAMAGVGGVQEGMWEEVRKSAFWHDDVWTDEAVRVASARLGVSKAKGELGSQVPQQAMVGQYARR